MRCRGRSLLRVEALLVGVVFFLSVGAATAGITVGGKTVKGAERLKAKLSAAEVVPGPGNPDLSAKADLVVNPRKQQICFDITIENVVPGAKDDDPVVGIHIHPGLAGTVCEPAQDCVFGIDLDFPNEGLQSCVRAGTQLLNSIVQQPGEFYLIIHTATFPAGALRGQLGKD